MFYYISIPKCSYSSKNVTFNNIKEVKINVLVARNMACLLTIL